MLKRIERSHNTKLYLLASLNDTLHYFYGVPSPLTFDVYILHYNSCILDNEIDKIDHYAYTCAYAYAYVASESQA